MSEYEQDFREIGLVLRGFERSIDAALADGCDLLKADHRIFVRHARADDEGAQSGIRGASAAEGIPLGHPQGACGIRRLLPSLRNGLQG